MAFTNSIELSASDVAALYEDLRAIRVTCGRGADALRRSLACCEDGAVLSVKPDDIPDDEDEDEADDEDKDDRAASRLLGDIPSLDLRQVEELLQDRTLRKGDLVELGHQRFGISRAWLSGQNREAAVASIEAATYNSLALDIISEEASRLGT